MAEKVVNIDEYLPEKWEGKESPRNDIIERMRMHWDSSRYLTPQVGYDMLRSLGEDLTHTLANSYVKQATGGTVSQQFDRFGKAVVYKAKGTAKGAGDAGEYGEGESLRAQVSGEITAETGDPTPIQEDQLAALLERIIAGEFGPATARRHGEVLAIVQTIMGLNNADAGRFYSERLEQALPEAHRVIATTTYTDPLTRDVIQRETFEAGRRDPAFRRAEQEIFPGAGGTFLGERALPRLRNQFQAFSPITHFGGFQQLGDLEKAFRNFISGPLPTGATLGTQLQNLISGVGSTIDPTTFAGEFTQAAETPFGRVLPAFQAAIQPRLQSVGPTIRGNLERILQEQFQQRVATDPQQFQTPQDVFQSFQERGFIPQVPMTGQ